MANHNVLVLMVLLLGSARLSAAQIPVRFAEGSVHAYLLLHDLNDSLLAQGDLLFTTREGLVEKRMIFHFKDGSQFEETVAFTQQNVYTMQSFHLVHEGPSFPAEVDITLERAGGKYHVKSKSHKEGREKELQGTIDLPADVYNGMVPDVVKDFPPGKSETVHYAIFTPEPRIIELALTPHGEGAVQVGDSVKTATRYVLKAHFGLLAELLVKVIGSMPPDYYVWIIPDEVPVFAGFEGQLFMGGPVWRIELAATSWPK
jgi:hypothetical protein